MFSACDITEGSILTMAPTHYGSTHYGSTHYGSYSLWLLLTMALYLYSLWLYTDSKHLEVAKGPEAPVQLCQSRYKARGVPGQGQGQG